MDDLRKQADLPERTCIEDGCERPARGPRCTMHYQRFRKAGGVSPPRGQAKHCAAPDCERSVHRGGLGYCSMHYQRLKRLGSLDTQRTHTPPQPLPAACDVAGCAGTPIARRLCDLHYRRLRRTGEATGTRRQKRVERYDAQDGWKVCTSCDERRSVDEFYANMKARDGYLPHCKPCCAAAQRESRIRDPELFRARSRANYAANAAERRRASRRWKLANRDQVKATGRLWYEKNRDRRRIYDQSRRAVRNEQCRPWRTPERSAVFARTRRARKLGAPQGDPQETQAYLAIIMSDPCSYCGAPAQHADHIVPLSRSGAEAWDNFTPACASCNCRKSNSDLLTFLLHQLETPAR